jgi:excinuclease ABC subunit C
MEQQDETVRGEPISLKEKLENLPTKPGVYQFKSSSGEVLYVGKAVNLRNRVRQYFQKSHRPDPRRAAMVSRIRDVELIVTDSEVEALILETTLIQKIKPRYNIDLKDDKSFPYIVVTNDPFPRVFATRRVIRDGSRYFGPYTDVKNMHASLKMIREMYQVRSCNFTIDEEVVRKRSLKICFDYHIHKCGGPCEGLVSRERYNEMIEEVVHVLRGKTTTLADLLEARMQKASEELRFEYAAELRDKIHQLRIYNERQKVVDPELVDRDLFALAVAGDDACGVVFCVRDGKINGRRHVYLSGVEGKNEAEVLQPFVQRYYFTAEDIPREVYLQTELEDTGAIERWLTDRRGEKVSVVVPKIGDKAKLMAMCQRNAQFLLEMLELQRQKNREFVSPAVRALQKDLRLTTVPRRIECFDISNIQGSDTVASMVVFFNGRPRKSDYRKYRIRCEDGPNDFASMQEVIRRRYQRVLSEELEFPDLIVVDGGKGQLSSAVEVLKELGIVPITAGESPAEDSGGNPAVKSVPIIGLAKRLEEVFVPGAGEPQSIPKSSPGLRLLQQIRDEAHRFAITYHRLVRSKRTLQTELDLIKGVGKKRSKELLEVFGSVQGIKFATSEQLTDVVGESVARKIKEYFTEEGESLV